MLAIQTILHPTDFSERSQHAFHLACALARDFGARLIVMHAVPQGTADVLSLLQLGMQQKGIEHDIWHELRKVQPAQGITVEHRLERGPAADCIVSVAEETQSDLIVMGSHGHTALGRLLSGSVADEVQRKAICPVLTVRVPFREKKPISRAKTIEIPANGEVAVAHSAATN